MFFSKVLLATVLVSAAAAAPYPQLHGEGVAADALFTDTDNGLGYGVENAENNVANTIKPGSAPTGNSAGGSPPPPSKRQLDKWAAGAQNIANAGGVGGSTSGVTDQLKSVDGTLTDGAANAGTNAGGTEASTIEAIGQAVPKRFAA